MKKISTAVAFLIVTAASAQQKNIVKEKWHWDNSAQDSIWGYASVLKVDNILYLSGVTSSGDFATQVKNVYGGIEWNLAKFGATFQNVVKENLYTTNMDSMLKYNYIRTPFYKKDFPAATWLQISRLGLADRMLEVEVTAHLPENSGGKAVIPFEKLVGTWTMIDKKGNLAGEIWVKKNENSMKGKSCMIKGTDTTILETVDWVNEGDDMFYIPVAYGQNNDKPVRFKLTSFNGKVYTFENPAHDYPKRIVYDFVSNNELHAYIDDGTENKRQHYNYKRVK